MKYIKLLILLLAIIVAPKVAALTTPTDNTLATLSLSNGITLTPAFSSSVFSYSATTDATSTVVSATLPQDSKATIISGVSSSTINLNFGLNSHSVIVKSETGTNTYKIDITRNDNRSTNNYLKTLSVNHGTIAFNKSLTTYSITVDQSVTSISASAEIEDSKAKFESGYGSPQSLNNLKYGNDNIIQFRVVAENESVKTYSITINRNDGRSSNSFLSSLSLSPGIIIFVKDTLDYSITVPFSTDSIDVTAATEDPKASVSLSGGNNLAVGLNTISIMVTPENGLEKRTYTISVFKLAEGVSLSSNNYLKSLYVADYAVKLSKDTKDYIALVNSDGPVDITPIADDSNATVTVTGNDNIKSGSIVVISVVAENGDRRDYKITLMRKLSPIILVALILIACIAIIIVIVLAKKHLSKRTPKISAPAEVIPNDNEIPALNTNISPETGSFSPPTVQTTEMASPIIAEDVAQNDQIVDK